MVECRYKGNDSEDFVQIHPQTSVHLIRASKFKMWH